MALLIDEPPESSSVLRLASSSARRGSGRLRRTGRPTSGAAAGHRHLISRVALLVSVTTTSVIVTMDAGVPNGWRDVALVVAVAAYVVMLAAERRWGGLTIGFVVAAMVMPIVAALSVVPRNGDLWSYAMYGRILGIHHVSPWTHAPSAFPHDPFHALVGRSWVHTPSVYGPLFTGVSAAAATVFGGAVLPTRLFYQALAALALAVGGLLVWRQTRSAAAVAFLAVHPLVLIYLVNPGRNDILVGIAMLAAVVLAARSRPGAAGAVGALGALVKVTGVVGIVALLVTTTTRGSRWATRRMALAAAAVFGLGYLATGPTALFAPMQTAGGMYSRASAWSVLPKLGITRPSTQVALVLLAILVLVVLVRHAHGSDATAVTATSGMLAIAAAYTLPGYAAWGLPVAALDHESRVSRIVAGAGLVLLMTYEVLRHPVTGSLGPVAAGTAAVGGPVLMVLLVIALLRTRTHPAKETIMTITLQPESTEVAGRPLRTLVVVPTLDEAANVATVLRRIRAALPAADVLVVDDDSRDRTPEIAAAVGRDLGHVTVLSRTGPKGLGPAYRAGFSRGLAEGYDVLVQMDADLSHDPTDLPTLVAAVLQGADVAIGSRYVPGGETPGWPARRRLLSRAGGWYARSMLRLPVLDVTSGYRAYTADVLRVVDLDGIGTTGFAFQIDMTDRARRAGAAMREVPIVFRDRTAGESKMSGDIVREALGLVTTRALHRLLGRGAPEHPSATPTMLTPAPVEPVRSRPAAKAAS